MLVLPEIRSVDALSMRMLLSCLRTCVASSSSRVFILATLCVDSDANSQRQDTTVTTRRRIIGEMRSKFAEVVDIGPLDEGTIAALACDLLDADVIDPEI